MKGIKQRFLAGLLVLVMIAGLFPTTALAAGEPQAQLDAVLLKGFTPKGGTAADVDLLTTQTVAGWTLETPYELSVTVNLTGSSTDRVLTIDLNQGMEFSALDLAQLKSSSAIKDAVFTRDANLYGYAVPSGVLTIQFQDTAVGTVDIPVFVKPDSAFFALDPASGLDTTRTVNAPITVTLTDSTGSVSVGLTSAGTAVPSDWGSADAQIYSTMGVPAVEPGGTGYTFGFGYWINYLTDAIQGRQQRLLDSMEAVLELSKGLQIDHIDGWDIVQRTVDSSTGSTTIRIKKQGAGQYYAGGSNWKMYLNLDDDSSLSGTRATITVKSLIVDEYGIDSPYTHPINDRVILNTPVQQKGAVEVAVTTNPPSTDFYISRQSTNLTDFYNSDNYNTLLGAVIISNLSAGDNNAKGENTGTLIYEARVPDKSKGRIFVTGISIPCDTTNEALYPTRLVVTDANNKTYTISDRTTIKNIIENGINSKYTFVLRGVDIPGYNSNISMKSVTATIPGLPRGFSFSPYNAVGGSNTLNRVPTGLYGWFVAGSSDTDPLESEYRIYPQGKESSTDWTTSTLNMTAVDAYVERIFGQRGVQTSLGLNGGTKSTSNLTALPGDTINVSQYIFTGVRLMRPAVYLLEPEGLHLENVVFYQDKGVPLSYTVTDWTDHASNVPEGWKIYRYTIDEDILNGPYDADWNLKSLTATFDYRVDRLADNASYDISQLFYLAGERKILAESGTVDVYNLNEGRNLAGTGSLAFNVAKVKELAIFSSIKAEDEDEWYTYIPGNYDTLANLSPGVGADVKVYVDNSTDYALSNLELYIPIPRKDQYLGAAFGNQVGGFDMYLKEPVTVPTGWTVQYGTVTGVSDGTSAPVADGGWKDSYVYNTDRKTVNMVKLTTSNLDAKGLAEILLKVEATDDLRQSDSENLCKTWYTYRRDEVTVNDIGTAANLGMLLQNGQLSGQVYQDDNHNSVRDSGEPGVSGVAVKVTDTRGKSYETVTDSDGSYQVLGLPTNKVLTVTITNPRSIDPNSTVGSYRFSQKKASTQSVTGSDVTSDDNSVTGTATTELSATGKGVVNAGLVEPYTIQFQGDDNTADLSVSSVKAYAGQTLGDVLPNGVRAFGTEGYFHNGWTRDSDSRVIPTDRVLYETVSGDEIYTAKTEQGRVVVTYEQVSGKAQTQNNDPLLVIGTVTGNAGERPEGQAFFMFSGDLTRDKADGKVDTTSTESIIQYGNTITRILDSSEAFSEAYTGGAASEHYNGYADLIHADITFANEEQYKSGGRFVRIPAELLALPVRIGMGHDVTSYYTDSTFTTEVYNEDDALYRVVRTYEYTTLNDGDSQTLTLGDLIGDSPNIPTNMTYSDVEVYEKVGGNWVNKTEDGSYTTGNVSDPLGGNAADYTTDFSSIKSALLDRLNGPESGKFWNQANASFGLAITYEYIAENICLTKYVPDADLNQPYSLTNSYPYLAQPGLNSHELTYTVYVRKDGTGNYVELPANANGVYEIDYNDDLKIMVTDSAQSASGSWTTVVKPEGALSITGSGEGSRSTWDYIHDTDESFGTTAPVAVHIIHESDGVYTAVEAPVSIQVNARTDALPPVVTAPASITQFYPDNEAAVFTVEAASQDGGSLTYQWYQSATELDPTSPNWKNSATKLDGETGRSLTIGAETGSADQTTYYYLEVTNTADVNGTTTATAAVGTSLKRLVHTAPTVTMLSNTAYHLNQSATPLNATASHPSAESGTVLTYQWYSTTNQANPQPDNDTRLGGATAPLYSPPTGVPGTTYYYAVVTSTRTDPVSGVSHVLTTKSNVAAIRVSVLEYTLTYNANGGSNGPAAEKYTVGTNVPLDSGTGMSHADDGGHSVVFAGWSSTKVSTILSATDTRPVTMTSLVMNKDETVYAVWGYDTNGNGIADVLEQEGLHKLTYDVTGAASGVTAPTGGSYLPGTVAALDGGSGLTHDSADGKPVVFAGWSLSEADKGKVLAIGDDTSSLVKQVTFSYSDITAYAVWGYDENSNGTADALEASYGLIYDANGGLDAPTDAGRYVEGSTAALSEDVPTHRAENGVSVVFIGWTETRTGAIYDAKDTKPATVTQVTFSAADKTVYAAWGYDRNGNGKADVLEENKYDLTYHANGGNDNSVPTDSSKYVSGQTVVLAAAPVPTHNGKDGIAVKFVGWTENLTAYDRIYGSGDAVPDTVSTVTFGDANKTVYAVWGYDRNNNGTADVLEETSFILTYDVNGGSNGPVPSTHAANETVPLDTTSRPSHAGADLNGVNVDVVFVGWSLTDTGETTIYTVNGQLPELVEQVSMSSNLTVYAVWGYDTNHNGAADVLETKYQLTYDANGGIGAVTDGNRYVVGNTVTLKIKEEIASLLAHPNADGAAVVFIGWTETRTGTIYDAKDTAPATVTQVTFGDADKTVYAAWGYDRNNNGTADVLEGSYALTYNANGGTGAPTDAGKYVTGQTVTLSTQKPTHADAETVKVAFIGWSLTRDSKIYEGTDSLNELTGKLAPTVTFADSDITVYALWGYDTNGNGTADVLEGAQFGLSYDVNGGTGAVTDGVLRKAGETVTLKDGTGLGHDAVSGKSVVFIGWSLTRYAVLTANDEQPALVPSVTFSNSNITVYAVWGVDTNSNGAADVLEDKYTLTYHANGGNTDAPTDTNKYVADQTVTLSVSGPTHAADSGTTVVFAGWTEAPTDKIYTGKDTKPAYITEVTFIDNDITVYAAWGYDTNGNGIADVNEDGSRYNLTYVITGAADSSTAPEGGVYLSGTVVTLDGGSGLTHDPVGGTDVVFAGWSAAASDAGKVLKKTDSVSMLIGTVTISNRNVTVYAVWGEDSDGNGKADVLESGYVVTYNANGGYTDGLPADSGKYAVGDEVILDDGSAMTHPVVADRVIFAGWSTTRYDKIFSAGETVVTVTSVTMAEGGVTAYAVWGYDRNNNGTADLYEADYGLSYWANGGDETTIPVDPARYVRAQQVMLHNGTGVAHAPEPSGEEQIDILFVGWSRSPVDEILSKTNKDTVAAQVINSLTFGNADETVYAVWGYDTNGNGIADVLENWDDPDPGDITKEKFWLIYDSNSGHEGSVPSKAQHETGSTVPLVGTPTHESVDGVKVLFVGWTLTPYTHIYTKDDTHPLLTTQVTFHSGDITVYALWGYDTNGNGTADVLEDGALLIYDVNGGDPESVPAPIKYLEGETLTLTVTPTHPAAKYHGVSTAVLFVGWSKEKADTLAAGDTCPELVTTVDYTADGVTVYAVWSYDYDGNGAPDYEQAKVTLIYDPNRASGSTVAEAYPEGCTVTLKNNLFTRSSYQFTGWNTDQSGQGTAYAGTGSLTLDTSKVLYAQWHYQGGGGTGGGGGGSVASYTLSFDTNGGTSVAAVSKTSGAKITLDQTTQREGYLFTGWYLDAELTEKVESVTLTKDMTVYAGWRSDILGPDGTGVSKWLNATDHIKYLNGYPGGVFGPNDNMTRAEAAQMFYNLLLNKDVPATVGFEDVDAGAWYAAAVHTLASLGIMEGVGDGRFAPERAITRAEFTAIAMRFATLDTSGGNTFSDVAEDAWYYGYVTGCAKYGWITGYPDGTFRPNATITRAEVTVIVNRMLGRSADQSYIDSREDGLTRFSDVAKSHWAYYDIMEATNAHDHSTTDGVETWTNIRSIYYTLSFSTNGGTSVDSISKTSGTEITLDQTTRREGYVFTGWYLKQDLTRKVNTVTLIKDTVVYAGWQRAVADPDNTGVSKWLNTTDHIKYLNGYPDGVFGPNDNMTRAEAAQMFYNLLLNKDVPTTVGFEDVDAGAWYAAAVHTLASLGIMEGVGDGRFAPERAITRAEFTAIAMRFATLDTSGENTFSDVAEGAWYYGYVTGCAKYGWITGYPDGTFRPNATITRAEVTVIVNRMLGRSADQSYIDGREDGLTRFSDVAKSHWAYYEIIEATNAHDYIRSNGAEGWIKLK